MDREDDTSPSALDQLGAAELDQLADVYGLDALYDEDPDLEADAIYEQNAVDLGLFDDGLYDEPAPEPAPEEQHVAELTAAAEQLIASNPVLQVEGNMQVLAETVQAQAQALGNPALAGEPVFWEATHRQILADHGDPTQVTAEEIAVSEIVNAGGAGHRVLDFGDSGPASAPAAPSGHQGAPQADPQVQAIMESTGRGAGVLDF